MRTCTGTVLCALSRAAAASRRATSCSAQRRSEVSGYLPSVFSPHDAQINGSPRAERPPFPGWGLRARSSAPLNGDRHARSTLDGGGASRSADRRDD